jgi:thiol-disulfide isomerase/thioredoxin
MNLFPKFAEALPLSDFLTRHGSPTDRDRWERAKAAAVISEAQKQLLSRFTRDMNVLILAGAWCGDCASQCPIFDRFAESAPMIKIRYLDRDEHPDVQAELKINGGDRVPVVVFFSEDGLEVSRYGERTLAKYRQMVEQVTGESCASGIVRSTDPIQMQVVQDWLNEFERAQWILRLSPRLRRLHGD